MIVYKIVQEHGAVMQLYWITMQMQMVMVLVQAQRLVSVMQLYRAVL